MTQTPITSYRGRTAAGIAIILLISGCQCDDEWKLNQAKRHDMFMECLKTVSIQPSQNHEDNNGHIVEECGQQAYYLAHEKTKGNCQ